MKLKKLPLGLLAGLLLALCLSACGNMAAPPTTLTDYSDDLSWAYVEPTEGTKDADLFFVCPTVYGGTKDMPNMSLEDARTKADFLGATNMELGIYMDNCRVFAPYYQQIGLNVYELPIPEREPYLNVAYEDVKAAFLYYLEHYNEGRPIVLAGFSQGADLSLRLLKDCFADEEVNDLLVACYAIGWSITEEELAEFPHLKMAQGEADTGVIVSFNSEAEHIKDSLMIPAGTRTLGINPLNWKTDSTPADASLNLGACFTDYSGDTVVEISNLTGAYLDPERGSLKVTDVREENYPAGLSIFDEGVYHLYDYQFFYRNLQENVKTRIESYLAA